MTLLLRTSTHLNKSLTRQKITFHETAQEYFLSSKFDNVLSTFFVDDLYQILSLFQNLLGLWYPTLDLNPFEQVLDKTENNFSWNCTRVFFELEIWKRVKYFFRRWPISNNISVSETTRIMTLLLRTWTHLKKSLTRLKIAFHETAQEYFLSSEFENVLSTFFLDDLYQIFSLFQNLLGLWHSHLGTQPIRTSPWQEWKSLFMKLRNCTRVFFELEIWRVKYFFRRWPIYEILSPFQNLLGLWHFYLGPQPIWTSPWQDWKSLFMKLHKSVFWARNLTTC